MNQLRLCQIVIHILERIMKGMSLEFATTRVFELESKKEFPINRIMIENYLQSLKNGLKQNKEQYLKYTNTTPEQMKQEAKKAREEMPRAAYRQFEMKGYD